VVAIGLGLAAVWLMVGRTRGTTSAPAGAAEETAGAPGEGRSLFGGVRSRPSDARGQYTVSAEIVDEDGQPVPEGSVVLTCLDPTGIRPIPDGVVPVGDQGEFEGPGCAFEVCVEFRHPSRVPAEPWVLRPSEPATLTARALVRFEGEVVDADGRAVAAATVAFTRPGGEEVDPRALLPLMTRSTSTDADGRFTVAWIERPPCDACREAAVGCEPVEIPFLDAFDVSVRAPGHGPVQRTITVEDAELHGADSPLRLQLPPSQDILSGRLVDPAGAGYPRAYVLARSLDRPSEQRRGEVDGVDFEIDGLGTGAYQVRAIQDGVELARTESAEPGQDVLMTGTVSATGPDLTIEVVDAQGRPASVRVDGGPFHDAQTDPRGQVSAQQVLPGELRVRVRIPGRRAMMKTLTVPPGGGEPQQDGAGEPVHVKLHLEAERP
jgi:hypothetical protein